jgi:Domain of unknown function (DUF397)
VSIRWRKSSYSGGGTAECVELAEIGATVTVRDSKNPYGPRLTMSRASFTTLVAKIKDDDPRV